MIAINNVERENKAGWQADFLSMLPEIERRLELAFRRLDRAAREESVAEGVGHSLLSFMTLHGEGRAAKVSASTLAWYAAKQVKHGRLAAGRVNRLEPLSRYAKLQSDIRQEPITGKWLEVFVEDRRASVVDQVAAKLDVGSWWATLSERFQLIARELAYGFSTSEVASRHGLSAGRISQLRRELERSWEAFQETAV